MYAATVGTGKVWFVAQMGDFVAYLRDYALGDHTRLIDWKASARRRRLIVRNQEAERNQTVLLLIDCGRLMNAEVDGVAKLDHAVNTALVLSHVALARGAGALRRRVDPPHLLRRLERSADAGYE